jgi:hypothetical protein
MGFILLLLSAQLQSKHNSIKLKFVFKIIFYRCYNKSLEFLHQNVQSTDIQRVKIQEVFQLSGNSYNNPDSDVNGRSQEEDHRNSQKVREPKGNKGNRVDNHEKKRKNSEFDYYNEDEVNISNQGKSVSGHGQVQDEGKIDIRTPRTFECELRGNLVNKSCKTGDVVNIIGIVKTTHVSQHSYSL